MGDGDGPLSPIPVTAKTIEPTERIVIEWPGYRNLTTVEWTFKPLDDGSNVRANQWRAAYHRPARATT